MHVQRKRHDLPKILSSEWLWWVKRPTQPPGPPTALLWAVPRDPAAPFTWGAKSLSATKKSHLCAPWWHEGRPAVFPKITALTRP